MKLGTDAEVATILDCPGRRHGKQDEPANIRVTGS